MDISLGKEIHKLQLGCMLKVEVTSPPGLSCVSQQHYLTAPLVLMFDLQSIPAPSSFVFQVN